MKRFVYLLVMILFPGIMIAQKNVTLVSQTKLLNIRLPAGSKEDKRMISTGSAKALLEMKSKKESKSVISTEVYYLPPIAESHFNAESLAQVLVSSGYQLREVASDKKYTWAEKENQSFLIYFSGEQNQTDLYIGACNRAAPSMPLFTASSQPDLGPSQGNNPAFVPPLMGRQKNSTQTKIETKEPQMVVYDLDSNLYHVMNIGEQYWLKENLRTTQFRDTTFIATGLSAQEWKNTKQGAYSFYDDNRLNIKKYGLLYNGYAAASGKLCPKGWHVATDEDWNELEKYLGVPETELQRTGERGNTADKLKNPDDWKASTFPANNSSGFSIVPAGSRQDNGEYATLGQYGNFWTSTVYDDRYGLLYLWNHHVHYNTNAVGRIYTLANNGYSCRCVKDKTKPDTGKTK